MPARADGFISPFIGFNFGGDSSNCASLTNCEDKRTCFGVSLGTVRGVFGFEEDFGYTWSYLEDVRQLYALAAEQGRYVLFTADQ